MLDQEDQNALMDGWNEEEVEVDEDGVADELEEEGARGVLGRIAMRSLSVAVSTPLRSGRSKA